MKIIQQINFRIDKDGYVIIKEIATHEQKSVAELSKQIVLEGIKEKRVELSLLLYKEGKIGIKRAWRLSGLSPFEFRRMLIDRNIEPVYNEKSADIALETALSIKMRDMLKK
ncbi:MAG: hypothetical protein ACTSVU_00620 [Promethearchaeota archaeon]